MKTPLGEYTWNSPLQKFLVVSLRYTLFFTHGLSEQKEIAWKRVWKDEERDRSYEEFIDLIAGAFSAPRQVVEQYTPRADIGFSGNKECQLVAAIYFPLRYRWDGAVVPMNFTGEGAVYDLTKVDRDGITILHSSEGTRVTMMMHVLAQGPLRGRGILVGKLGTTFMLHDKEWQQGQTREIGRQYFLDDAYLSVVSAPEYTKDQIVDFMEQLTNTCYVPEP